jgi:PAS domain S-box-containing protein
MIEDVTECKRTESLLRTRLQLAELAGHVGLDELAQATLDAAVSLTRSQLGFLQSVDEDQKRLASPAWFAGTARSSLETEERSANCPLPQSGVWVECLNSRAPVIHNDCAGETENGMREEDAQSMRELAVPILRGGLVVALLGVGGKPADYTRDDVEIVQTLAAPVVDMVAHKQAEEALHRSEEKFRAIANYTVDWETWHGADGRLVWVSPAVERITGYSVEECHAMADYPLPIVAPEDREFMADQMRQAIEGVRGEDVEFRIARKDGGLRWGSLSWQPIFNDDGKSLGFRAGVRDITGHKNLEERLRQSQKMEAIGQLAAGVAHEFNNIMAAMTLHLNLLEINPPDAETRECLEEMEALSKRSTGLVRQLLAFSRQSVMRAESQDLNEVLNGLARMLRPLLGENIHFELSSAGTVPPVHADRVMIEQALMNLCLNARDAMPRGGRLSLELQQVEVDAERAAPHPDVRPGLYVRLSVTDTGCGMGEETLRHLFEPFFSTKGVGRGTGLGLATVYGIVEQHHGWVEVESQPGKGSSFHVFLPAAPAARPAQPAITPETLRGGNETILLVEDDPSVRKIMERFLQRHGYRVLKASNGHEALSLWAKHHAEIDLLYTDMIMPESMNGLELTGRLRQEKPGLKVIISSGYSTELTGLKDMAAPGITFLPKPFSPEVLTATIRTSLDETKPPGRE